MSTTSAVRAKPPSIPMSGCLPASNDFGFWTVLGEGPRYAGHEFLTVLRPTGIIIELRSATAAKLAAGVAGMRAHQLPVAFDPVSYFTQTPVSKPYEKFKALPWGSMTPPASLAGRRAFCASVVNHCLITHDFGADVLIAPYFLQRMHDRQDWCAVSMECAAVMQASVTSMSPTQIWAGAALTDGALLHDGDRILPALSSCPIDVPLYLLIATRQRSSSPLGRPDVLQAIKELITALTAKGIKVIVGRRYSSGLLLGTFGAVGWSTGASSLLQNLQYRRPGGGTATRTDWYYVPELMDSLSFEARATLLKNHTLVNQLSPTTAYAQHLFQAPNELRTACPAALRPELFRHNMLKMREQALALHGHAVPQRRRAIRSLVTSAEQLHTANSGLAQVGASRAFLAAWGAIV